MAMAERIGITVGITTRNRRQSLLRCLDSLTMLGDLLTEVIVVDDSSDLPVADALGGLAPSIAARTRVLRQAASEGYIVARNTIMRHSATEYQSLCWTTMHICWLRVKWQRRSPSWTSSQR